MRGTTTRTSNHGPPDVSKTLLASGSSGRDPSQTSHARQASNGSAIMISDLFLAGFMPPMIAADRSGGQATEGPSVGHLFGFLKLGIDRRS